MPRMQCRWQARRWPSRPRLPHRIFVGEATGVRPAGLVTCSRLVGDRLGGAVPGVALGRGPAEGGSEPMDARSWLVASARGDITPPPPLPPPKDSLRGAGKRGQVGAGAWGATHL